MVLVVLMGFSLISTAKAQEDLAAEPKFNEDLEDDNLDLNVDYFP